MFCALKTWKIALNFDSSIGPVPWQHKIYGLKPGDYQVRSSMLAMTIGPHSPWRILPVILCLKFQKRKLLHVSLHDLILKDKHIIPDKQWCIVYQHAPLQTEVSDQSAGWPDLRQCLPCTPSNILTVICNKLWLG